MITPKKLVVFHLDFKFTVEFLCRSDYCASSNLHLIYHKEKKNNSRQQSLFS